MTKLALDTETNGLIATVEHDPHGAYESPRECAMKSVFFGFHRSFASPDPAPDSDPETARDIANAKGNICLPVWLYSHCGTCYRAAEQNPFHCPWDSGLFGFIYITRDNARKIYGIKRITEKQRLRVLADLAAQVETYSQWANGETYCWVIEDAFGDDDGDVIASCRGYYSEDDAESDALAELASLIK